VHVLRAGRAHLGTGAETAPVIDVRDPGSTYFSGGPSPVPAADLERRYLPRDPAIYPPSCSKQCGARWRDLVRRASTKTRYVHGSRRISAHIRASRHRRCQSCLDLCRRVQLRRPAIHRWHDQTTRSAPACGSSGARGPVDPARGPVTLFPPATALMDKLRATNADRSIAKLAAFRLFSCFHDEDHGGARLLDSTALRPSTGWIARPNVSAFAVQRK